MINKIIFRACVLKVNMASLLDTFYRCTLKLYTEGIYGMESQNIRKG